MTNRTERQLGNPEYATSRADRAWLLFNSMPIETKKQQHKPAEYYVEYMDVWKHQEPQLTLIGFQDAVQAAGTVHLSTTVQRYIAEVFRRMRQEISVTISNRLLVDAFQQLQQVRQEQADILQRVAALELAIEAEVVVETAGATDVDMDAVVVAVQSFLTNELRIPADVTAHEDTIEIVVGEDHEDILADRTADLYQYVRSHVGPTVFRALNFGFEIAAK